jgi:polyisoprenoid-binding protein YceI
MVRWVLLLGMALGQEALPETQPLAGVSGELETISEVAAAEPVVSDVQGPTRYTLDTATSSIYVVIRNDLSALMSGLGHDHVIQATKATGTINWDPAGASPCKVSITVPVSGLKGDPLGMREKAGLNNKSITASQMQEMEGNMFGKRQLSSSLFPLITYEATKCSGGQGDVSVEGNMTIRGVSKSLNIPMRVTVDPDSFHATGKVTLSHSDFGFSPFSVMMGGLRNQDSLEFSIDVKAKVSVD